MPTGDEGFLCQGKCALERQKSPFFSKNLYMVPPNGLMTKSSPKNWQVSISSSLNINQPYQPAKKLFGRQNSQLLKQTMPLLGTFTYKLYLSVSYIYPRMITFQIKSRSLLFIPSRFHQDSWIYHHRAPGCSLVSSWKTTWDFLFVCFRLGNPEKNKPLFATYRHPGWVVASERISSILYGKPSPAVLIIDLTQGGFHVVHHFSHMIWGDVGGKRCVRFFGSGVFSGNSYLDLPDM